MMGVLGVSPVFYGWTFAATAAGIMGGAFVNGKLSARAVPASTLLTVGFVTSAVASLAILGLAHSSVAAVGTILPFLVLNAFCTGLIGPNANQGALHPVPDIAGVAAAVLGSSRMFMGAFASLLIAIFYDGRSAHAMGAMMSVFSLASLAAYFFLVRPAERNAERLAFVPGETEVGVESKSP